MESKRRDEELLPEAAAQFLEAAKRQQIYLNPEKYEHFTEEEVTQKLLPQLNEALKVLGDSHLVHNDIKPANIFWKDRSKWEILKIQNPNVSSEYVCSTVMYRKDLYTLKDSGMQYYSAYNNGRCRCITWAVLQDKTSGKSFCFVSTHWDGDGGENAPTQLAEEVEFVNTMAASYPVITTGDYNSNEYTNSFKSFLSQTNSADAMYAAANRVNVAGSWHDFGKDTPSAGSCDHITATKSNVKVLKFETLMYNEQIYCSDHAWIIADLQFIS